MVMQIEFILLCFSVLKLNRRTFLILIEQRMEDHQNKLRGHNFQQNLFCYFNLFKGIINMTLQALFLFICVFLGHSTIMPPLDPTKRPLTKFLTAALSQYTDPIVKDQKLLLPVIRKGMTWLVKNWPIQTNTWAAQVGCTNCDAYNGDTLCSEKLPLLCVIDYKTISRPFYDFPKSSTPAGEDGGYYNGWTGGYFSATQPIQGNLLTSKVVADKICKQKYGANAQAAEHNMGRFMKNMNDLPNVKETWSWEQSLEGRWNAWGYIKGSLPCGKMWAWANDQANGNCGSLI